MGLPNALRMSSGFGALHVAMLLAGVTSGSEVISTSMTAEATNTGVLSIGANVFFADIDARTGNLDPDMVTAAITSHTSAICVVHYAYKYVKLKNFKIEILVRVGQWIFLDEITFEK